MEQRFVGLVQQTMAEEQIPGLAAAVVTSSGIVWERAFGFANLESERPVTVDTPFEIASTSKTILAVALMQAMEQGLLTLDTEVNAVGLPFTVDNPLVDDETITLRHLVTHTSGILDGDNYFCAYYVEEDLSPLFDLREPGFCPNPTLPGLAEFLEAYLAPEGDFYAAEENFNAAEPGAVWEYTNVGAALAGLVLRAATGTPLDEHCESQIFEPLGMTQSHWHRSQFADPDRIASQYELFDDELFELPPFSFATWPDGGVRSSIRDLATFAGAMLGRGQWQGVRILAEDTWDTMVTTLVEPAPGVEQGVFWLRSGGVLWHDGGDPGVNCYFTLDPEAHFATVLLMNLELDAKDPEASAALWNELMTFGHHFVD